MRPAPASAALPQQTGPPRRGSVETES